MNITLDAQAQNCHPELDDEDGWRCFPDHFAWLSPSWLCLTLPAEEVADRDGSFTMNPPILIDGVEYKVRGCILVFDNRRMAAISGLQKAQYGVDYKTNDSVEVDYAAWANCKGRSSALWRDDPGSIALRFGESPCL